MTRILPPHPNLEHLKNEAKALLKAHKNGEAATCKTLRLLQRLRGASDEQILAADLALHECQFALAMDYGFKSWMALKVHIDPSTRGAPSLCKDGDRVWIEQVPDMPVGSGKDRQLRGLLVLLDARGVTADMDDLLAYGGNAFAFSHPDRWHETTRLAVPADFMWNAAAAFGCNLQWHITPFRRTMEEYEPLTYAALAEIRGYIDQGQPVLVGGVTEFGCDTWSVAVGYDEKEPQLAHIGLGKGRRWMAIRGVAFPCLAEEGLDKHWNAQVQVPRKGAYTHWLVNPFVTLTASSALDRRERVIRTLCLAVEMFKQPTKPPDQTDSVNYWFGQDAYEHVADDLENVTLAEVLDTSEREAACRLRMLGDQVAWLDEGRKAAAAFCRKAARDQILAPSLLRRAADEYSQVAQIINQEMHDLPKASQEEKHDWYSIESNRRSAARAYRDGLNHERQAIAEIEKALEGQTAE